MADFTTVITDIGAQKIAEAIGSGGTVNLTEMAVGDGNGNPVTVVPSRTALLREVYRTPLNQAYQDTNDSKVYIFEMVIPEAEGGWTVREVGLFDNEGDMIAYANFPQTYKPTIPEGASQDLVIQIYVIFSNDSVVNVTVNAAIAIASRQWVIANFLSLLGGTTGQIIRKKSNADNDIEWVSLNLEDFSISVDAIEEPQTLATGQTTVTWNIVTTNALAVYVDGLRLTKDEGFTVTDDAIIELTQSYPDGTPILGVQNDPNSSITPGGIGALAIAQNLSDLADKSVARGNLGVPYDDQAGAEAGTNTDKVMSSLLTKQQIDARRADEATAKAGTDNEKLMTPLRVKQAVGVLAVPSGAVMPFAMSAVPNGWLECNGQAVSRTTYALLYAAIGDTYGPGNGSTTFNLPDLRGQFLRGWDHGRGLDPNAADRTAHKGVGTATGDNPGTEQEDQNKRHSHEVGGNPTNNSPNTVPSFLSAGTPSHVDTSEEGGDEARPTNVYMMFCIKT